MEHFTNQQFGVKTWSDTSTKLMDSSFLEPGLPLWFIVSACIFTASMSAIAPVETLIALLVVWGLFR